MGIENIEVSINELARKQMIRRLLADILVDILVDINVCKLEGWDYKKYINEIKSEIDRLVE